ncbi:MAG: cytochrome c biogenesis protein CcsA [Aquabacterium sp.]|nr:cytochrome c biogenesis protein CcsA [Aquabacterium sp.]
MILSPASFTSFTSWPSGLAVLAYVVASAWPAPPSGEDKNQARPVWAALCLGWLAQALAIVLDTVAFDGPTLHARFGFAPALSVTTWLVLAVYAIENRRLGLPSVRRALALLAALTVILAWLFPGQAHPQNVPPLAPLHWLTGFASYGLIGAALLHAALLRHAEKQLRAKPVSGQIPRQNLAGQALGMPLLRLESLTLRFVGAGFVMLSLTLLLGALFATPWRWDHKTIFSVLSWLVFAVLLIGRARFGWRGRQAVRWLVAGSALLLLAYVGSRFVLEVLLHRSTT